MWLPWWEPSALRQLGGLPPEALEFLIEAMVHLCTDPYDRLYSVPAKGRPDDRVAELGDFGFLQFRVDHEAGLLRVYRLVWTA